MSTAIASLTGHSLNTGSLSAYLQWVNRIPLLTETEEKELADRLRYHNDVEAARKLVLSHLRLVARIARGYAGYGLPQGDLIQEGSIGLMKAVKRFNPDVGVRLVSFAIHWIRAEIHEFILRNWRIVRIATTKAQRKLFFNIRKHAKERGWFSDQEANEVAEILNVSKKEVHEMEQRLNSYDETFDFTDTDDAAENFGWNAPARYLEDKNPTPEAYVVEEEWEQKRIDDLQHALTTLDERSRDILAQRWLAEDKATLHDLAAKYQVSAERIRQLESAAMKKIRHQIEEEAIA